MNSPARQIVILGGGTAGWMAANLFAGKWRDGRIGITLVESPDIGIIGVGEGSTPTLKRFFQLLGIPESDWMPRCNATYKLGISFDGWSPASGVDRYSHPFISEADAYRQQAFLVNCRTRRLGLDVHTAPGDFLLNGVLARLGKGPQSPPNFPFGMEYGYHFDSGLLGAWLAQRAAAHGVCHVQARVVEARQDEQGDIAALVTDDGSEIAGDFFVDCTGFAGLLMEKTLGVPYRSFSDNLFNDAAVVMPTPAAGEPPAETVSIAMRHGWRWKIPLTRRFGNGYVYSSNHCSADEAEYELRESLGLLDSPENARHLKMRVGQLERHWERNCIALGLSQGFIEPLEATALHLVQQSIELFIVKYEKAGFGSDYRDDYNRRTRERFERVRDYIVAHYKLNTRDDTDYWRANRDNDVLSESLRQILDTWFRREDLTAEIERQDIESHFGTLSWHCLLSGYGAFPPFSPKQPGGGDLYREQDVARFLAGCSLNFDSHAENLARLQA